MEAVKARLARGYSQSAPRYDALAGHMYVAGIRRLLPRARIGPMSNILDIGCGTGVNLLEAARWFAPTRLLCGIDISPGMVEVASRKAAALGVPAQFTVGDAEKLPYPDELFDLILCNSVFHWFKDRAAALREMHRVLRPGGQVLLICASAPGFREWFALIDQLRQAAGASPESDMTPALPTAMEVVTLMQETGFAIEHMANPIQFQTVSEPEFFVRLMTTVAPHWFSDLPPEGQQAMERLAARVMRTHYPMGFPNTWSACEAVGVRTS